MTSIKKGIESFNNKYPELLVRIIFGIIIVFIFGIVNPGFLSPQNLFMVIAVQSPFFVLLACAVTIGMILGGIDLSVGSCMAISTCTCALLLKQTENVFLSILVALLVGACIGIINGVLISKVKVPIFIATYGMDWLIKGILYILMDGLSIFGFTNTFLKLGKTKVGPFPLIFVITTIIVIIVFILMHKTTFGKRFYATSINKEATKISGISTVNVTIVSYIIVGLLAASSGVMYLSTLNAVDASIGENWTLKLVAITLLGGTKIKGGVGSVLNTVVGALIYLFIMNAMSTSGIPATWQDAVIGCLVILSVSIDAIGVLINNKKRKLALKGA